MFVSIVICTHNLDNLHNLSEAIESLLNQTHEEMEVIVVIDGNQALYEEIVKTYSDQAKIRLLPLEKNIGLSGARNAGAKAARGDVIAFFDDDAFAERDWLQKLVNIYENSDAVSVGGKIKPIWLSNKPGYFPDELGWLVGVTHEGFAEEEVVEVRNTFGPNMSFRKGVFDEIGFFNEGLGFGKRGTSYLQGEEAEFTVRMKRKLGKGVIYTPQAVVYHKIPPSKVKPKTLLRRSFYQGYSKALLKRSDPSPAALDTEGNYLKDLLFKYIPRRIKGILSPNAITEMKRLALLITCIISVGLGFLWGHVKG